MERGERPWGYYLVLHEDAGYKVKQFVVRPGSRLSLQRHRFRAEHWQVVRGEAEATRGKEIVRLLPGGSIDIRAARSGEHIDVTVHDTGRGIPGTLRDQVFRPGFSTKRRGWGLGLALTRRIVEEYHDGSIRLVESRPGKGAVFLVRLPAA